MYSANKACGDKRLLAGLILSGMSDLLTPPAAVTCVNNNSGYKNKQYGKMDEMYRF